MEKSDKEKLMIAMAALCNIVTYGSDPVHRAQQALFDITGEDIYINKIDTYAAGFVNDESVGMFYGPVSKLEDILNCCPPREGKAYVFRFPKGKSDESEEIYVWSKKKSEWISLLD